MARNLARSGWLSLACAAALVVSCNKGGDSGATGGAPNPLAGGAAAAGGPLDYIPKDAGLVVGVNWSKFKGTKFHTLLVSSLPPDAKTKMDEFKAACSIDPLNDLDSVTVGVIGNLDKQSKVVVVVKGNWDEDKISKCATAYGEKKGKKLTVAKDGNITSYTPEDKNDKTVNVGWAGNLMVFTSQSMEGDKTYLAEVMKKSSSVKDNKAVMDLLGKTDQGGTLYGGFVPAPGTEAAGAFGKMTGGNQQLAGAYFTMKLASDLDLNVGLRFGSDADAKAVADKMSKELDGAKNSPQGAFLNKTTVSTSGSDAIIKVALDEKQLDQISEMAKQMAPMIMGGMLGGQ